MIIDAAYKIKWLERAKDRFENMFVGVETVSNWSKREWRGDRKIAIARELTKLHEQIWRGKISEAQIYFGLNVPRGEFTLVVEGKQKEEAKRWPKQKVLIAIKLGLKLSESPSALAKRVAQESGWERREIYHLISSSQPSARN